MYIVYETNDAIESIRCKYLVLELDTLEFSGGETVRTFAVIDNEHIVFQEIPMIESIQELHCNLIKNYRLQNWNYCKQAIDHLAGNFKGELDSYYEVLLDRISVLEDVTTSDDWTGNILTEQSGSFGINTKNN